MRLRYDELDKLTPCAVCGSRRYWLTAKCGNAGVAFLRPRPTWFAWTSTREWT